MWTNETFEAGIQTRRIIWQYVCIETDRNIGIYPFTEFRQKGAHHDPLGGWFTNKANTKLISEYKTYKLGLMRIEEKLKFEERSKEFNKKFNVSELVKKGTLVFL